MKDEKWEFPFDGYVCPVCGNPVCNECGKCNDTKCTWEQCIEAWDIEEGFWEPDYWDKKRKARTNNVRRLCKKL